MYYCRCDRPSESVVAFSRRRPRCCCCCLTLLCIPYRAFRNNLQEICHTCNFVNFCLTDEVGVPKESPEFDLADDVARFFNNFSYNNVFRHEETHCLLEFSHTGYYVLRYEFLVSHDKNDQNYIVSDHQN